MLQNLKRVPLLTPNSSLKSERAKKWICRQTYWHILKGQLRTTEGPAASVHYCTCKPVPLACGDSFPFTIRRSGGDRVEREQDVAEPMNSELTLHSLSALTGCGRGHFLKWRHSLHTLIVWGCLLPFFCLHWFDIWIVSPTRGSSRQWV